MVAEKHFTLDMTIAKALAVHPGVAQVLAGFHLGGCAHCHLGQVETLGEVCAGYGIDSEKLLEVLESVLEPAEA